MPVPNDGSKPAFHAGVWFFLEALLILSYAVKTPRYRWFFFVSIASIVMYSLIFTRMDDLQRRVGMPAWGMGCRLSTIFSFALTNILLCDLHRELRLVDQRGSLSEKPFLSRISWGIVVWGNPRGINFAHEPTPCLPPRPLHRTRLAFFSYQILSILYLLFLYDLTGFVNRANPYYAQDAPVITSAYQRLWRLVGVFHGIVIYLILEIQYILASLISGSLGITSPSDWPDLFGSFRHGYTLRGLWGKSWHQMFRRMTLTHARFLSTTLHIPRKSRLGSCLTIFCAFFVSGLLHYAGDAVAMQSMTKSVGALQFFVLQAVGIMFEDAFRVFIRRLYPDGQNVKATDKVESSLKTNTVPNATSLWPTLSFTKLLGYLWVVL